MSDFTRGVSRPSQTMSDFWPDLFFRTAPYSPPKFQTKPDFEKAGNSTSICTWRKPVKLVLKIVFRMTCANVGIVLTTNQRSVWRHACAPCTDLLPCVVAMFLVFLADFRRAKLCCENQISILFYIC